MVQWRVFPELRHDVLKGFSMMSDDDLQNDLGSEIKLIGRWHDVSRFEGVAICECENAQAMANWALNWNNAMELETSVVLDDDEVRALGKARFS
ncbi:MAG: DUF3303 family protein [Cyclobacteriaceae bacterium]